MGFAEKRKRQLNIKSIGQMYRDGDIVEDDNVVANFVQGPEHFDNLHYRWSRGELLGVIGDSGCGKCLAKGTGVIMADGSIRKVEDVKVGEQLMGPDSKPRNVMSLARGREKMYKVTSTKGESYTVNASHILSLRWGVNKKKRDFEPGQIYNINVEDYLKLPKYYQSNLKGWRVAIELDEKETAIEPYLMGLWLGDGAKGNKYITNMDVEVIDYLTDYTNKYPEYSLSVYHDKNTKSKVKSYNLVTKRGQTSPYLTELKKALTEDNQKQIPKDYLYNSKQNRLELLAGIIDTDGYLNSNCYEVIIKDDIFADQFEYLVRSLGLGCGRSIKKGTIKSTNFVGYYHRFSISGDTDMIPCKVERRKATQRKQIKNVLNYGITIEEQPVDEYYGFQIDGDHLFLLEDFSVTHNTEMVLNVFKHILKNNPKSNGVFISLEMTTQKLATRWFQMTQDEPDLMDRLFIISRYDQDGKTKDMSLSKIKMELNNIRETVGDVCCFALDHLHVIGENDVSSLNSICINIKEMCVENNAFGILLAQVNKASAKKGEVPLDCDSVYACSQFKWIVSYAIQIHRPIRRLESDCGFSFMGWGYAKVREEKKADKNKVGQNKVLVYDPDSRDFRKPNKVESARFKQYYEILLEIRKEENDDNRYKYDIATEEL